MLKQYRKMLLWLRAFTLRKEPVLWVVALLSTFYLVLCIYVILFASRTVTDKYISMLDQNSAGLALLISRSLDLSDEDIRQLKVMEPVPAAVFEAVQSLSFLFEEKKILYNGHRHVYVFASLDSAESSFVTAADSGAVSPSVLPDGMYLFDIHSSADRYAHSAFRYDNRSSGKKVMVLSAEQRAALESRSAGSMRINDNRDDFVFAYAPLYTRDAGFAGMVGIELYLAQVASNRNSLIALFLLVFLVPAGLAILLSFAFYVKYVKPLKTSSITDSLTGLYNREYFKMQYERTVNNSHRYQSELSIIMLDIDYFKQYNDSYGHQAGDECLIKIAHTIKNQAHRPLDLVFRYGGEEFLILLPDTGLEGATNVASKIKSGIEELNIEHKKNTIAAHVTISQGIFVLGKNAPRCENIHEYIDKADRALYRSKHDGKNRYTVFIPPPEAAQGGIRSGLALHSNEL